MRFWGLRYGVLVFRASSSEVLGFAGYGVLVFRWLQGFSHLRV